MNPVSMHTAVSAYLLPLLDAGWNSPIKSIAMNSIGCGGDEKCSFFSCCVLRRLGICCSVGGLIFPCLSNGICFLMMRTSF